MAFSWHFPPLSHPQRAQLSELESARARLCSCPLAAARRPKVTGPKRSSKAWPNSGIHSGSVRFFMGIFWDVWDSDHVFFFFWGVVSVGWKYVQNQLDLHRGLYVTFMGISMISLYRGISYIHATRNDPFMWFMCRDMYHHHGACGVAMLDKSSPQLLGSRHAHGWPSNQKKEHKKKTPHACREKTWRTNRKRFKYIPYYLCCASSHLPFQQFNHKKHPIYAPMAAPGVDPWRPKSCIVPPIPSTLASSCHEKKHSPPVGPQSYLVSREKPRNINTHRTHRIHGAGILMLT